jgi:pimeloyl-ACP methyl ester carboxylesterase
MKISESAVGIQYDGFDLDIAVKLRERGDDLLILLHGLGCSKESFDGAFSANELRGYAVCALDFPGHGRSSRPSSDGIYSLEAYADITQLVIKQVLAGTGRRYNRLCVAGHSMGGAVAVLLSGSEREVASLVSNAPS